MPVVADCTSVLIRNATIEERYPGGVREFENNSPNRTFCTDGLVSRVAFMDPKDAEAFIDLLTGMGFVAPSELDSLEIAVFEKDVGFYFPCSWLHVAMAELGEGVEAPMAWLRGTDASTFIAPPGWQPGMTFNMSREDVERDYELVGEEDGVETRRHRTTGELIYQGRPRVPRRKRWWEFWR
jgi:hypothetical protein